MEFEPDECQATKSNEMLQFPYARKRGFPITAFARTISTSEFRSQNRTGCGTRFIGAAITQGVSFETERWAACENANVNIGCKIVLVLKSNAMGHERRDR